MDPCAYTVDHAHSALWRDERTPEDPNKDPEAPPRHPLPPPAATDDDRAATAATCRRSKNASGIGLSAIPPPLSSMRLNEDAPVRVAQPCILNSLRQPFRLSAGLTPERAATVQGPGGSRETSAGGADTGPMRVRKQLAARGMGRLPAVFAGHISCARMVGTRASGFREQPSQIGTGQRAPPNNSGSG